MGTHRMRMVSFAGLTAMLTLAHPASTQAFDDARFCEAIQEIAKERASNTRIVVVVHCSAKIIDFKIRLAVPVNELPAGWQDRTHVQLNRMYCHGPVRAAINNGWTIAFTIMSAHESYYMTAECR
jgi:hypothetical protein